MRLVQLIPDERTESLLVNLSKEPVKIEQGMRIGQLVIAPVVQASVSEVATLDETERGAGGFGSTGV